MSESFAQRIIDWHHAHGRKTLPWQINRDAFRVWISEIMLQQTQVATVVPYFLRFIQRFPNVSALAAGDEQEVLALWAGLGYYARARNLLRCALELVERHRGEFPRSVPALTELPGIGRSTAGAILSLAYEIPAPILDGNVKRVFCRHFGIEGWPGAPAVANELWGLAESLLPAQQCGYYNQGLMDIGATVCTRSTPACGNCPLSHTCLAYASGDTTRLPTPRPRKPLPLRRYLMLVASDSDGRILLERRPPVGIWGGLWCFPMHPEPDGFGDWGSQFDVDLDTLCRLPAEQHALTHFLLEYVPLRAQVSSQAARVVEPARHQWIHPQQVTPLGIPAPVRRFIGRNFKTAPTGEPTP